MESQNNSQLQIEPHKKCQFDRRITNQQIATNTKSNVIFFLREVLHQLQLCFIIIIEIFIATTITKQDHLCNTSKRAHQMMMALLIAFLGQAAALNAGENSKQTSPSEKKTRNITVKYVPVALGYASTVANPSGNCLVTYKDWQYIGFWDQDHYMVLGKRKHGTAEWQFNKTKYKGHCEDAHRTINLRFDGDGYLHVAFDHHASPLRYVRSEEPESINVGEEMPMIGRNENKTTYPEFYNMLNGDMILLYRDGISGRGNLVMNRYITKKKQWTRLHDNLIDGEGKRNGYWTLLVDEKGIFHLAWSWRDSGDCCTLHDCCYARSRDEGVTWEKTTGEICKIPMNFESAEYAWRVAVNTSYGQGSPVIDESDHVYITGFWHSGSGIPQQRLIWNENGTWHTRQTGNRITPFSFYGGGTVIYPMLANRYSSFRVGNKTRYFYFPYDIERGHLEMTIGLSDDFRKDEWEYHVLTRRPGRSRMDEQLWARDHKMHFFRMNYKQAPFERPVPIPPQPIYIMEVEGIAD
jgi:hypothetical protein